MSKFHSRFLFWIDFLFHNIGYQDIVHSFLCMKHGDAIHFVHTHIHVIPFVRFGLLINIVLLLFLGSNSCRSASKWCPEIRELFN